MIKLTPNQLHPKWQSLKLQNAKSVSNRTLGKLGYVLLATSLVVSGCDTKQTETAAEPTAEITSDEADSMMVISPSAKAAIKEFEAEFIHQMINLQQSQQAEYEALQAADAPEMEAKASQTLGGESNKTTDLEDSSDSTHNVANQSDSRTDANSSQEPDITDITNQTNAASTILEKERSSEESTTNSVSDRSNDNQITREEVTAVTLQDLPLATNVVLVEPQILTAQELSNRYNTAMQSLYLPEDLPLPAQAVDTLLNIATLTPHVFSNPELAQRLTLKSPALARFLKQYQKWEQLEAEHSEELEALAKEFATKIEEYDKQIEKYEKMLEDMTVNE